MIGGVWLLQIIQYSAMDWQMAIAPVLHRLGYNTAQLFDR
jgi:hypothetical protein